MHTSGNFAILHDFMEIAWYRDHRDKYLSLPWYRPDKPYRQWGEGGSNVHFAHLPVKFQKWTKKVDIVDKVDNMVVNIQNSTEL